MAYGTWEQFTPALGGTYQDTDPASPYVATGLYTRIIRSGTTTPGFGKYNRKSRLELPVNPFSLEARRNYAYFGDLTRTTRFTGSKFYYTGSAAQLLLGNLFSIPDVGDFPSSKILSLQNQLDAKMLEKLKNQKVNLGQVYAERMQTVNLIGSTATRIASSFISLRKGDLRGAARALGQGVSRSNVRRFKERYRNTDGRNAISKAWLELQYGWKPLLDDVVGSAELLAAKQASEIKAKAVTTKAYSENEDSILNDGNFTTVRAIERKIDYRLVLWYRTDGIELATIKEMGLLNPVSLAWELLPYSFVADWFIPIGSYINSLDATLGLSFFKGSRTFKFVGSVKDRVTGTGGNITYAYTGYARGSKTRETVNRVKLIEFPQLPYPSFKNPFSITHALNAIALVRVAFSSAGKLRS